MEDFRIITSANEPVPVIEGISPDFSKYLLSNSNPYLSKGTFGDMLFQHFRGNEFDIWYSNFLIRKPSSFIGTADGPVLELQIPLLNEFESSWDGMEHIGMRAYQYEMTYTPFVKTRSTFPAAGRYQTFDMHFTASLLEPYALYCRKLSIFLEKVLKNQPANLLDTMQLISIDMLRIINSVLHYNKAGCFSELYFDSLVHEFMTLLCIQVAALTDRPQFSAVEIRRGTEARNIIMADFEHNYTIEELAKMTGSTALKLQMVFKYLFGTTVHQFSKEARLAHAYTLLQTTNYPLRVICLMVGYADASNFATAFKNQYGFGPGKIMKV